MSDLADKVAKIQKKAAKKPKIAESVVDDLPKTPQNTAKIDAGEVLAASPSRGQRSQTLAESIARLPWWAETERGVPNGILRSALFGIVRRGKRAFLQGEQMAKINGLSVLFTGPRLDQADLDVWEYCLCLAKTNGLGTRIEFSGNSFLKAIERDTGKSQHDWLENALRRLMSSVVEIKDGNKVYAGQLIHDWARDDKTKYHVIEVNPAIQRLYGKDGWTKLEWEQRSKLSGRPLAQWLHGFYASHANPFDIKIETIHQLCMSENSELRDFKREVKESMRLVCKVANWKFDISENKLSVNKPKTSKKLTN